jgi:hypothetical protein
VHHELEWGDVYPFTGRLVLCFVMYFYIDLIVIGDGKRELGHNNMSKYNGIIYT